jgi:hypothetical protein
VRNKSDSETGIMRNLLILAAAMELQVTSDQIRANQLTCLYTDVGSADRL